MQTKIVFPTRVTRGTILLNGVRIEDHVQAFTAEGRAGELSKLTLECAPRGIEFEGDPVVCLVVNGRRFRVIEEEKAGLFEPCSDRA